MQSLVDKHNVRALREALKRLHGNTGHSTEKSRSAVLRTAYSDIFERIKGQLPGFRELAERVLMWIAFARQRFTAKGLQAMVATKVGEHRFDKDNVTDIDVLISVCCGLVTLQSESNVVQLVHYTTQGYLEEHKPDLFPHAFTILANDCITHLMYDLPEKERDFGPDRVFQVHELESLPPDSDSEDQTESDNMSTLRLYSSYYWGHHVMMAERSEGPIDMVDQFLRDYKKVVASAIRLLDSPLFSYLPYGRSVCPYENASAPSLSLHLVSFFGLIDRIGPLVKTNPASVNDRFRFQGRHFSPIIEIERIFTPLHLAVLGSQLYVINLLIDLGADLHSKDHGVFPPLALACELAHQSIVDLLISKGANVNEHASFGLRTPLHSAVRANSLSIVKSLIDHGADINACDSEGCTALIRAIERGHKDIACHLIVSGAEVNSKGAGDATALTIAALEGDTDTVSLLLQYDCFVDHCDLDNHTALYYALQNRVGTAQVLLDAGARVGIKGDQDFDPLEVACRKGNTDLMTLLLQYDEHRFVDVFFKEQWQDVWLHSPVELAAIYGQSDVVRLLLSTAPERPPHIEWRHIVAAASAIRAGHLDCARILASHLAEDPEGELLSPVFLHMAACPYFVFEPEVLERFISFDPGLLRREDNGSKALILAAKEIRHQFLLEKITGGTEFALQESKFDLRAYRTTLVLLEGGADPALRDRWKWTAQETSQKCDGDDLPAFIEALGFDSSHWHVLSKGGLTWYSGMMEDCPDTVKHMAD